MKKNRLGKSDLFVSQLGLGCMSLGTDMKNAEQIIHAALETGINYFDTADLYDFGVNEEIVGNSLKSVRDQVIIATKVGNRWKEDKSGWRWDASKAYIKEQVKQSLKRLNIDFIDLYQLHGGTMEDRIDEVIEALEELKDEGFIRYYGISSIRPTVIHEYANRSDIVSVMMQYSMLDRRPEEQAFPLLKQHGISAVVRGPLAQGMLSDAFLTKASPTVKEKGYLNYSYDELAHLLPILNEKLSTSHSMTAASIQFVLSHPVVGSCVTGASSVEQLKQNVAAAQAEPLTEDELSFIKNITKHDGYSAHRI